jgi:glycosyltransferase involved in cell wall biosynthesis
VNGTCIVIPTYNNAATLAPVIEGSLAHGLPVIVVNDGSTDATGAVLEHFRECQAIRHEGNKGKGFALLTGFEAATRRGMRRAITIDSDLQHDPAEIPRFLAEEREHPDALMVGARDIKAAGAPRANRFGNAMSNCYFRLLSGARLPDTQSGFRSYPIAETLALGCPPSRFEFEFVILVAAARAGIPLRTVSISVRYERKIYVSHFRPLTDFVRIFRAGLRGVRANPAASERKNSVR